MIDIHKQISLGPEEEVGIIREFFSNVSDWQLQAALDAGGYVIGIVGVAFLVMFFAGKRN